MDHFQQEVMAALRQMSARIDAVAAEASQARELSLQALAAAKAGAGSGAQPAAGAPLSTQATNQVPIHPAVHSGQAHPAPASRSRVAAPSPGVSDVAAPRPTGSATARVSSPPPSTSAHSSTRVIVCARRGSGRGRRPGGPGRAQAATAQGQARAAAPHSQAARRQTAAGDSLEASTYKDQVALMPEALQLVEGSHDAFGLSKPELKFGSWSCDSRLFCLDILTRVTQTHTIIVTERVPTAYGKYTAYGTSLFTTLLRMDFWRVSFKDFPETDPPPHTTGTRLLPPPPASLYGSEAGIDQRDGSVNLAHAPGRQPHPSRGHAGQRWLLYQSRELWMAFVKRTGWVTVDSTRRRSKIKAWCAWELQWAGPTPIMMERAAAQLGVTCTMSNWREVYATAVTLPLQRDPLPWEPREPATVSTLDTGALSSPSRALRSSQESTGSTEKASRTKRPADPPSHLQSLAKQPRVGEHSSITGAIVIDDDDDGDGTTVGKGTGGAPEHVQSGGAASSKLAPTTSAVTALMAVPAHKSGRHDLSVSPPLALSSDTAMTAGASLAHQSLNPPPFRVGFIHGKGADPNPELVPAPPHPDPALRRDVTWQVKELPPQLVKGCGMEPFPEAQVWNLSTPITAAEAAALHASGALLKGKQSLSATGSGCMKYYHVVVGSTAFSAVLKRDFERLRAGLQPKELLQQIQAAREDASSTTVVLASKQRTSSWVLEAVPAVCKKFAHIELAGDGADADMELRWTGPTPQTVEEWALDGGIVLSLKTWKGVLKRAQQQGLWCPP